MKGKNMVNYDNIREKIFQDKMNLTEKQKDILIAATELFATKGFAATSTSEIAKKAKVAEGTIFRHYKTKKELLLSLVDPLMIRFIGPFVKKDINKVLAHDFNHFEEFLRAMIKNRTAFLRENMHLIRIFIQEVPFHPELKERFIEHVGLDVFNRFREIIVHFQERGEIIEIPPESVIRLAGFSVFGYVVTMNIIAPKADWDEEAEIERTIQFIMKGLSP